MIATLTAATGKRFVDWSCIFKSTGLAGGSVTVDVIVTYNDDSTQTASTGVVANGNTEVLVGIATVAGIFAVNSTGATGGSTDALSSATTKSVKKIELKMTRSSNTSTGDATISAMEVNA